MVHILLVRNSKRPPCGAWRLTDDQAVIERWIAGGGNIGTMLKENSIVVVDIDAGKKFARTFWRQFPALCGTAAETRRGIHLYFTGETGTRKWQHGDIKGSGYVVAPPSIVNGWHYRWIKRERLPAFPETLFPTKEVHQKSARDIRNARAYIGKIVAVSGRHGHDATFRAACKLRDAGFSEVEALAALVEWNQTNADPPWSAKELLHKVTSAFAKVER